MSQEHHQANPTRDCPGHSSLDAHVQADRMRTAALQSDEAEVDQLNELLKRKSDWEVELAVSPYDQHRFLRVYQVQADAVLSFKRVLLGAIQWGIDPAHLIAAAAISDAYYRLGLADGKKPNRRQRNQLSKQRSHLPIKQRSLDTLAQ